MTSNFVLTVKNTPSTNTWIIDSGVSRHMISNESLFVFKKKTRTTIIIVNGEVLHVKWIDNIEVELNGQTMQMKNVLYVSKLNANFLSISVFNRKRFEVSFAKNEMQIKNKNILIANEIVKDRMYLLRSSNRIFFNNDVEFSKVLKNTKIFENFSVLEGTEIPNEIISEKKRQTNYRLWHERLKHISWTRMKTLHRKLLRMNEIHFFDDDLDCTICNLSKFTKKMHRETLKRTFRRLRKVHTDVWNSYRTVNIEGNRYFVFMIDDLTRKSWIALMKFKIQMFEKIREWHVFVNLKTKKKRQFFELTTLRSIKNSKNWWIRKTWKRNSRRHTFLKRTVLPKNSIERSCKWHDQCLFERSCLIDFGKKLYASPIICEIWYRSKWIKKNLPTNYETIICQILIIFENSNA